MEDDEAEEGRMANAGVDLYSAENCSGQFQDEHDTRLDSDLNDTEPTPQVVAGPRRYADPSKINLLPGAETIAKNGSR